MGSRTIEIDDQSTVDSTPEDVAALYAWANLRGAKYRDYSATRREYRAQVRYRAAKALLQRELAVQVEAEAESSAGRTEREAFDEQATPHLQGGHDVQASQMLSQRVANDAARKASLERVETARRAEAAAHAGVLALREEREIAEAHSSALRQASVYEESELRRRQLAGPQPYGLLASSYASAMSGQSDLRGDGPSSLQQFLYPGRQASTETRMLALPAESDPEQRASPLYPDTSAVMTEPGFQSVFTERRGSAVEEEATTPAWLNSSQPTAQPKASVAISQAFKAEPKGEAIVGETLQDSRERVAARWFALKGVFEHIGPELPARRPLRPASGKTPLLALFSLAGGVGKTSLVATLGRALASQGEKVVLADTTSHGLLGIYFGSPQTNAATNTTTVEMTERANPPISLVIHDFAENAENDRQRDILTEEILRNSQGNDRLLLDLSSGSSWLIRRMVDLHPIVLVPIAPDMNSVISLQAVERLFRGFVDSEGRALLPFYVLNQFDASLPLHLDVREVFRRRLGDRLLRFAIRRSQAVGEALADGMTVLDYAPEAPVSQDYRDIALWLRSISGPATEVSRRTRWGER